MSDTPDSLIESIKRLNPQPGELFAIKFRGHLTRDTILKYSDSLSRFAESRRIEFIFVDAAAFDSIQKVDAHSAALHKILDYFKLAGTESHEFRQTLLTSLEKNRLLKEIAEGIFSAVYEGEYHRAPDHCRCVMTIPVEDMSLVGLTAAEIATKAL